MTALSFDRKASEAYAFGDVHDARKRLPSLRLVRLSDFLSAPCQLAWQEPKVEQLGLIVTLRNASRVAGG